MCFDDGVIELYNWCSEREYQRGDEIAWYADGDKIVRNEYNPATAYAFGKLLYLLILTMEKLKPQCILFNFGLYSTFN